MKIGNALCVNERSDWRAWLSDHHDTATEVWLILYKRHTGKPSIPYDDAVEEALCFGWIDSIVQRIDDETYAQKYTPRKNTGKWSQANIRRVRRLIEEGRMTPAGLRKVGVALSDAGDEPQPERRERVLPADMQGDLMANKAAWENFNDLPPALRRNYVGWIMSAKRQPTRQKRLGEMIEVLARNERLGMK